MSLKRGAVVALAVVLVGLAGLGDYLTGDDTAFTLVYLAPVALAAWRWGRSAGLFVAALSATSWLVVDHQRTVPVSLVVQLWNVLTELGVFVTVSCLLAALAQRLELESRRGLTDPLTGLKNRRGFDEAAAAEIDRARRHHHPFTVAFIDLDDFKLVNDGMGHEAGDQVLVGVADIFRRRLRAVVDGALLRSAHLERASLIGARLVGARMEYVWLTGAHLGTVELSGADMEFATIERADFVSAIARGATLSSVNGRSAFLSDADFTDARLDGADLREAVLAGARLIGADLSEAQLAGANVSGCDFTGAKLDKADLRGVTFQAPHGPARGLTLDQLRAAITDDTTVLPDYLKAPPPRAAG